LALEEPLLPFRVAARAVYSGNAQYPPGQSPIETVTVSAL
jgi:hypothetical protein